jgi:serine/threonine protein kinase
MSEVVEEVATREGSASLAEAMKSVDNGMKELVQHLEHQFGDNDGDEPTAESPKILSPAVNHSSYIPDENSRDNFEDEINEEEYEVENVVDVEEHSPSPQEVFSSKLFTLVASLQESNANRFDDWANDDDAGYLTITLSELEFSDFEERSAVKVFMEKAKHKEVSEAAAHLAEDSLVVNADLDALDHFPIPPSSSSSNVRLPPPTAESSSSYVPIHKDPFAVFDTTAMSVANRRNSITERRRSEIMGQHRFQGADGTHCFFNLKVIFEPYKTGFEESKDLKHPPGTIIAGRYEVQDVLGSAAFSTALQCQDHAAEEDEAQFVCLKVIKNNKDFFDQSLDEIKLLQYINSRGDPDEHHVLRLIDFFYCKEHLFIVSELLKENLYEFGRFIREHNMEAYYTLPRLKRITKQVLEALSFIHSLRLIHCDVKPENIVIRSFSRCDVKLIDFGSSCFTTDHLTTYIQSRSYRAPEVVIGHPYDSRIDIWSVGAVIAELFTGYVLFQNDSVQTMLARITGIMGKFPEHVLQEGRDTRKYFTVSDIVYEKDEVGQYHLVFPKRTTLEARLHLAGSKGDASDVPSSSGADQLSEDEALFVDFIRSTLCLDPRKRPTAYEALQHPWLRDADTVEFEAYIIGQPVNAEEGVEVDVEVAHGGMAGSSMYYPPPYDDNDDEEDAIFDDVDAGYDDEEGDEADETVRAMYSQSMYEGEEDDEADDMEVDMAAALVKKLAAYQMKLMQDAEEEIETLAAAAQHEQEANSNQDDV